MRLIILFSLLEVKFYHFKVKKKTILTEGYTISVGDALEGAGVVVVGVTVSVRAPFLEEIGPVHRPIGRFALLGNTIVTTATILIGIES